MNHLLLIGSNSRLGVFRDDHAWVRGSERKVRVEANQALLLLLPSHHELPCAAASPTGFHSEEGTQVTRWWIKPHHHPLSSSNSLLPSSSSYFGWYPSISRTNPTLLSRLHQSKTTSLFIALLRPAIAFHPLYYLRRFGCAPASCRVQALYLSLELGAMLVTQYSRPFFSSSA